MVFCFCFAFVVTQEMFPVCFQNLLWLQAPLCFFMLSSKLLLYTKKIAFYGTFLILFLQGRFKKRYYSCLRELHDEDWHSLSEVTYQSV